MKTRSLCLKRYNSDTLRYVFDLSYNALTLWKNVIASISCRSMHKGAVIASYSYRFKLIDQRNHLCLLPLFLTWICFSTYPICLCTKLEKDFRFFSQRKLFKTKFSKIYMSSSLKQDQKSPACSVIAIMLHYILRSCITLHHSIARLSFLNTIELGT
jgi:hypothetical protein